MTRRTYLDANILIAAWQASDPLGSRALAILDDPNRQLLVSEAVWLEIMPKPLYQGQQSEVDFYQAIFDVAEVLAWRIESLYLARDLAQRHGIAAMDAIHVAIALGAEAVEFVTAEKPEKPLFRLTELPVYSIR